MDEALGQTFKREREKAMTPASFATRAGLSVVYVRKLESGERPITEPIAELYDNVLNLGGILVDLYHAEQNGDDMRRRTLIAALATVASTGLSAAAVANELLRRDLLDALAASDMDWQEIAWDYGRRFMTDPPAVLRTSLSRDLLMLRGAVHDESPGAQLAAPRLMLVYGMMLANAGHTEDGRRWYRTARMAADQAAEAELQQWVRGREAFRLGYEGTDPALVLRLGDGVEDVEARLAVAQAYARINEPSRSREAIEQAWRLYDRGDQDEQSIYAMPAWRMALSVAYAHALLGDVAGTEQLLDQVDPPPTVARWHAQRDAQLAVAFAKAHDPGNAREVACMVDAQADPDERSVVLSEMCRLAKSSNSSS